VYGIAHRILSVLLVLLL